MKSIVVFLAVSLASPIALAAVKAPALRSNPFLNTLSTNRYNLLEGVALNAAVGSRTITLSGLDRLWARMDVVIDLTWSAATTVTMTTECAGESGIFAFRTVRDCSAGTGTCTVSKLTDEAAVTASIALSLKVSAAGCDAMRFVFGGAGATGSDTVNVNITGIAGQ